MPPPPMLVQNNVQQEPPREPPMQAQPTPNPNNMQPQASYNIEATNF
jgi:hypothetical protein